MWSELGKKKFLDHKTVAIKLTTNGQFLGTLNPYDIYNLSPVL